MKVLGVKIKQGLNKFSIYYKFITNFSAESDHYHEADLNITTEVHNYIWHKIPVFVVYIRTRIFIGYV
jgi:hypothetical protein